MSVRTMQTKSLDSLDQPNIVQKSSCLSIHNTQSHTAQPTTLSQGYHLPTPCCQRPSCRHARSSFITIALLVQCDRVSQNNSHLIHDCSAADSSTFSSNITSTVPALQISCGHVSSLSWASLPNIGDRKLTPSLCASFLTTPF